MKIGGLDTKSSGVHGFVRRARDDASTRRRLNYLWVLHRSRIFTETLEAR